MKFIHAADIHIGMENYGRIDPETGLSTRLGDFLKAFDKIVDYAIHEKVDLFLFAGDAYKHREPTPTHQREFAKRILKLTRNGIPCVLLVGNHDTSNALGKATSLDIYSTLEQPDVHVMREPSLIEVKGLQILGIPWLSRQDFAKLPETLPPLFEKIDPNKPAVVTIHASLTGAQYGSERLISLTDTTDLPKEWFINPKICYVALGHIHQRQVVNQDPPMVYAGSIERIDFGEAKEDKSFEVVEITEVSNGARKFKASHFPVSTKARRFVHIICDVPENANPTEMVLKEIAKEEVKEAVVKITVNLATNATDLDTLRIKEALKEAFVVGGITKNIARVERGGGTLENVEGLTMEEALEKYLLAKSYDPAKIATLKKYAQDLLKEI